MSLLRSRLSRSLLVYARYFSGVTFCNEILRNVRDHVSTIGKYAKRTTQHRVHNVMMSLLICEYLSRVKE